MARNLLSFMPKPTPAHARLSVDTQARTSRLVQQFHVLTRVAPEMATYLEHVAADLHARAVLSARAPMSRCRYL
jgi:hypothetical protein